MTMKIKTHHYQFISDLLKLGLKKRAILYLIVVSAVIKN